MSAPQPTSPRTLSPRRRAGNGGADGFRTHPGLSPRRAMYAEKVFAFLQRDRFRWRDEQVRLSPDTYRAIADDLGLSKFEVDLAIDDLYAAGMVEIQMVGTAQWVTITGEFPDADESEHPPSAKKGGDSIESPSPTFSPARKFPAKKFSRRPRATMFETAGVA